MKSDNVRAHFEKEAEEFDTLILKLIPRYNEMIEALISGISFKKDAPIRVMDLGCGTGNITYVIKNIFPKAQVTCLDLAQNMVDMAQIKLKEYKDIDYITGDFYNFNFNEKYDLIISSLALHHLITDNDKKKFYRKIYRALKSGGIFLNADVVLGSNPFLQELYLDKWKEFLNKSISMEEIEEKWVPAAQAEDHPAKLFDQLNWLVEIGFKNVDIIWKYYGGAVYGGYK